MAQIKEVTVYGSNQWSDLKPLDLSKINVVDYPEDQYFSGPDDIHEKKQIVLHHTVSGPGIRGDLNTWLSTDHRIATCIIVERDGTINQLFSSKYWGAHLGAGNSNLDRHSIAIELDNWGQLSKKGDDYYAVYGNKVNVDNVVHYPEKFRDEEYFEAYPIAQLRAVGELLLFWKERYDIPLTYNEDMWDISKQALGGWPGVWTHVSYRKYPEKRNKWDCHPDPNLKSMLRTISNL